MSASGVIRIRRSDVDDDSFVLLHVSRSDSAALDLKITATEGESPYTTTVRQSQLKKTKAKNYQGPDDEWKDIVIYILGLSAEVAKKPEFLLGIEASASINGSGEDDKELVVTVRKRIESITQKLGSLTLQQDDEQSIELFEWSNLAIARADSLDQRFNSLRERYRTAEETINSLNRQLEEFINMKNQHEQQLMANLVQLLNEKKLKIRNQQRLLASATVDPDKLFKLQATAVTDNSNPNGNLARGPKRSAKVISDESESEDGFENMDFDKSNQEADVTADVETHGEILTPQPIEDKDNTTDDEGSASPIEDSSPADKQRQGLANPAVAKSPPPRRNLPFARRAQKELAPAQREPDETGETDDDEL
ncbi:hypothetical protein BJX99DRAFT_264276 [Aspergillus californicus]